MTSIRKHYFTTQEMTLFELLIWENNDDSDFTYRNMSIWRVDPEISQRITFNGRLGGLIIFLFLIQQEWEATWSPWPPPWIHHWLSTFLFQGWTCSSTTECNLVTEARITSFKKCWRDGRCNTKCQHCLPLHALSTCQTQPGKKRNREIEC